MMLIMHGRQKEVAFSPQDTEWFAVIDLKQVTAPQLSRGSYRNGIKSWRVTSKALRCGVDVNQSTRLS
jgi:hypothetical protein